MHRVRQTDLPHRGSSHWFVGADQGDTGVSSALTASIMRTPRALLCSALCFFAACAVADRTANDAAPEFLNSGKVLPATLPFSEAVRVGNTLYLSGQIGITPGTMSLVPGGIQAESRQTMENIRTTLAAHGYAMSDIVKCTVMLAEMADWPAFNAIYQTFFSPPYPARSALGANGLALGARVEVECLATGRVPAR